MKNHFLLHFTKQFHNEIGCDEYRIKHQYTTKFHEMNKMEVEIGICIGKIVYPIRRDREKNKGSSSNASVTNKVGDI